MFSQHRDDVLLASCHSSAACHHRAEAFPVRWREALPGGEGLEGIFMVPLQVKGCQEVQCHW